MIATGYTIDGIIPLWEVSYTNETSRDRDILAKFQNQVITTLHRIPDRIILAIAGRDLNLGDPHTCICGWAIREQIAEMKNMRASEVEIPTNDLEQMDITSQCATAFGGTRDEWACIFYGVIRSNTAEIVEDAFVQRFEVAASR